MKDRSRGGPRGKKPMSGKASTIKDVAEMAGVAPGTVSNVLTGRRAVAQDLRRRVLRAVEALDYRPNQIAASLRSQQSRSVGIVVPDLMNPFFGELLYHIDQLAATSNFQTLLVGSNEKEIRKAERIQGLTSRRVGGLVIATTRVGRSGGASPFIAGIPTVVIGRCFSFD